MMEGLLCFRFNNNLCFPNKLIFETAVSNNCSLFAVFVHYLRVVYVLSLFVLVLYLEMVVSEEIKTNRSGHFEQQIKTASCTQ